MKSFKIPIVLLIINCALISGKPHPHPDYASYETKEIPGHYNKDSAISEEINVPSVEEVARACRLCELCEDQANRDHTIHGRDCSICDIICKGKTQRQRDSTLSSDEANGSTEKLSGNSNEEENSDIRRTTKWDSSDDSTWYPSAATWYPSAGASLYPDTFDDKSSDESEEEYDSLTGDVDAEQTTIEGDGIRNGSHGDSGDDLGISGSKNVENNTGEEDKARGSRDRYNNESGAEGIFHGEVRSLSSLERDVTKGDKSVDEKGDRLGSETEGWAASRGDTDSVTNLTIPKSDKEVPEVLD